MGVIFVEFRRKIRFSPSDVRSNTCEAPYTLCGRNFAARFRLTFFSHFFPQLLNDTPIKMQLHVRGIQTHVVDAELNETVAQIKVSAPVAVEIRGRSK